MNDEQRIANHERAVRDLQDRHFDENNKADTPAPPAPTKQGRRFWKYLLTAVGIGTAIIIAVNNLGRSLQENFDSSSHKIH